MQKQQPQELSPQQILDIAKKHKHSYGLVLEPATIDKRNFQLYNITLKRAQGPQDYINFRRGLTYIDEIIQHKHQNFAIAKKGLRKFHDLMPEWLDLKQSHFTNNKNQLAMKNIFLSSILGNSANKIRIYDTQKLNGENIQISAVYGDYWVIGTKNKTLLLRNEDDIKQIKYKHQHLITIQVAKQFFAHLRNLTQQKVKQLKQFLQSHTLIGQLLNPKMSQHVVLYQKLQIIFFALVSKQDKTYSCKPVSQAINLCNTYGLKHAKFRMIQIKNQQQLVLTTLQQIVMEIQESKIKQKGQGSVLYIQAYNQQAKKMHQQQGGQTEHQQQPVAQNLFVCKVKTLEYRIFRKLRQKLKLYIQKYKKSYQKSLKKYCEQVKQLVRQFKTPKPLEYYFNIAQRAFQLCQDQTKTVSRFVSVEFVNFLLLCKNKDMTKEKFMEIANNKKFGEYADQSDGQQGKEKGEGKNEQQQQGQCKQKSKEQGEEKKDEPKIQKKQFKNKHILVFVPMTIPSTGKSTLFQTIKQNHKTYPIHILSSDSIRLQVMQQKMKKMKNMSKKDAYEKSRKQANERFYEQVTNIYRNISKSPQSEHIFLVDKNHPQNALKAGIQQYRSRAKKFANLEIKIICLLPQCSQNRYMSKKSKYFYPFSAEYVLTCLKRVSKRQEHQTLQGNLQQRLNIVINFTNMFRNFHLTSYNLGKYFDYLIKLKFFKQEQPENKKLTLVAQQLLIKILMSSKVGSFDMHSELPDLAKLISQQWQQQPSSIQQSAQDAYKQIDHIFNKWNDLKLEDVSMERKQ